MTADAESQQVANIEGTRHAVELAERDRGRLLPQVSSIAAAGLYKGDLARGHVRGGREPRHPPLLPHQARVGAGRPRGVRAALAGLPAGDRGRRLRDRRDGQDRRSLLLLQADPAAAAAPCRSGCRRSGSRAGEINIVPVDFVAKAIDHIAHEPGLDGKAFRSPTPRRRRAGEVINLFARSADAPQMAMRLDPNMLEIVHPAVRGGLMMLPAGEADPRPGPRRPRDPRVGPHLRRLPDPLRLAPTPRRRSRAAASRCRPWRPTPTGSGTTGSATSTPTCSRTARCRGRCGGKVVLITGASSGIGKAAAIKVADAGGDGAAGRPHAGEARGDQGRDRGGGRGRPHPPLRPRPTSTTSSGWREEVLDQHGHVDVLVNNAGRSIRRSVELAYDRFHDYERTMQLNYFGAAAADPQRCCRRCARASLATSSTSARSACRPTRRASRPTSPRRRRSTPSAACIASEVIDDGVHDHDDPHAAGADADDRPDPDVRRASRRSRPTRRRR